MPPWFALAAGEILTNLSFRMRPWSVISGQVRYEDGDAAVGIEVVLYREYYLRARHGFRAMASGVTNDRGEYRVHGLEAGPYFVAARFEGNRTGPNVRDQGRLDAGGRGWGRRKVE